jgi:DeoR family transcriptional regulator of aga operon
MLTEERRQHLLAVIHRDGRVVVSEIAELLGISRMTIRKDLDHLETKGLVQRTHGGALVLQVGTPLPLALQDNEDHQAKAKQRIADAAIKLVSEGQCILLDSGTTTTTVARALRVFSFLTVVTNAVNIAAELATTDFDVILIGGTMRKNSFALVGPLAEDVLREIHADILFLGVDGFDPRVGLTTPNVLEARINRAMVRAATKVVVVCESTKFNQSNLSLIVPTSEIHVVITDKHISEDDAQILREKHVEMICV